MKFTRMFLFGVLMLSSYITLAGSHSLSLPQHLTITPEQATQMNTSSNCEAYFNLGTEVVPVFACEGNVIPGTYSLLNLDTSHGAYYNASIHIDLWSEDLEHGAYISSVYVLDEYHRVMISFNLPNFINPEKDIVFSPFFIDSGKQRSTFTQDGWSRIWWCNSYYNDGDSIKFDENRCKISWTTSKFLE